MIPLSLLWLLISAHDFVPQESVLDSARAIYNELLVAAPHKVGICPGTVLYYQARCYEEMGDQALAERFYSRAREYADATIGTSDGLALPGLAEHRLQRLKRTSK